jgi:hypothetical protein
MEGEQNALLYKTDIDDWLQPFFREPHNISAGKGLGVLYVV